MIEISVRKHGPYLVKGVVQLKHADGRPIEHGETFVLCRCGHSASKPFCDGSHKPVGFNDKA
jgi:CDGSH-type Zn-finger protein